MATYTKQQLENELKELDKKIDEVKMKMATLDKVESDEYKDGLDEITQKRNSLKTKWNQVKDEGDRAWEDVKDDFHNTMDELKGLYNDIKRKIS